MLHNKKRRDIKKTLISIIPYKDLKHYIVKTGSKFFKCDNSDPLISCHF